MTCPADTAPTGRYVLVGGPRTGKSTYARALRLRGIPTLSTDTMHQAKEPESGVEYLPAELGEPGMWSAASEYVAHYRLNRPGPFCLEGVATVRALRKWLVLAPPDAMPAEHVVLFAEPMAAQSPGQAAMGKGVATVWAGIESRLRPVVESPCGRLMGARFCAQCRCPCGPERV